MRIFWIFIAVLVFVVMCGAALAAIFYGEAVSTTGATKVVGQQFDLSKGQMDGSHATQSSGNILVVFYCKSTTVRLTAGTGSGIPFRTVTTIPFTTLALKKYPANQPWKYVQAVYTSSGRTTRTQRMEIAGP